MTNTGTNSTLQALREEITQKTGKTPEQLYEEREKRIRDAIELKEPDRVPLWIMPDPVARRGVNRAAAYYDPVAWKEAIRDEVLDFEPDMSSAGFGNSGASWEALCVQNKLWPGGPLPPDYDYQYVEGEYMMEDEYDMFLKDPSDFVVRRCLPRIYGALKPLSKLPPLSMTFSTFEGIVTLFTEPEFEEMAMAILKAGKELKAYREAVGDAQEELCQLGFPAFSHPGGAGIAPFDTLSSFLRGMKGSMVDMYRRPEKLIAACEAILEQRVALATPADPNKRGNPKRLGMPLWRGDKSFMSQAQFEKFYWPGLKGAMQASIDLGFVPMPFFEAHFGDRLECLHELPAGKSIAFVEHMDNVEAKQILGGHTCVIGKAPASLKYAPINEVEAYYKDVMDKCAPGGGFMMNVRLPENASIEELKTFLNNLREYATY